MRKSTVKTGLTVIAGGIALVTAVTFCHEWVALLLRLSPESELRLVAMGLFWGGLLGGVGVVIAVTGLFRAGSGRTVRLCPVILVLLVIVILFCVLFFTSLEHPAPPRLRPNDTITI